MTNSNPNFKKKKARGVVAMFNGIAPTYDFLNHLLSWGIDKGWRKKSVRTLKPLPHDSVLDIACGTGDFTFLLNDLLQPTQLIGCDLSTGMLEVAKQKMEKYTTSHPSDGRGCGRLSFEEGDALNLPYQDEEFDAVTISYGIRNLPDRPRGLREMLRVLKPGGHLLIVELATPPHFPWRQLFHFYSHVIMPTVGKIISGDIKAYKYLIASMEAFPQAEKFQDIILQAGFSSCHWHRYTFGLCTMFLAEKK